MLSRDQRILLSTAIMVMMGCVIAWYVLVGRNRAKPQPSIAQHIVKPDAKERRPAFGVPHAASDEPRELRPLPPPTLMRRRTPGELPKMEAANPKTAGDE